MRTIDGKFHVDGDQIIKTSNGEVLPQDEPLFLIRGRDRLALAALLAYRDLSTRDGCNDFHFESIDREIARFEKFAQDHPERMKQPSVTRGI